jgi:hypothetical protein
MEFLTKSEYNLSYLRENIEFYAYSLICFFVPFLLGHPQLLVGVIVNTALVLAALNLKGLKLLPIIMLPSLAVFARGLLFGPYSINLLYLIPVIWVGNALLVFGIKYLYLQKKKNKWYSLTYAISFKVLVLLGITSFLVTLGILSAVFLVAMGLLQIYTAAIGGTIALASNHFFNKLKT